MANGRMITKDICGDKRVNQITTDTGRLAFTWLITFADREGRTHGDPAMVRSMLFPRRQDVSIEMMESIIIEWATLALVVWYEEDGDLWIWFPGFDKNQPGLRKDKEAPSRIPEPTERGMELVRSRYGLGTAQVPVKLKEENRREGNSAATPDYPVSPEIELYHEVTGLYPDAVTEPKVKANIQSIRQKHKQPPREKMLELMGEKFALWCSLRTDDGRPYNPSNPAWLEWCVTGYNPQERVNGKARSKPLPQGL